MFSSTACSTSIPTWSTNWLSVPPGPVPARIKRLAETLRTLDVTGDQSSTEGRDDLIEELYFAVVRWKERPEIVMLLGGLPLPLTTDEHVRDAHRLLSRVLDAIEDAEAEFEEAERRAVPAAADRDRQKPASAQKIHPVTKDRMAKLLVAMAVDSYDYRGPEKRGHTIRDIKSAVDRVGLREIDHQTIGRYLKEGAKHIEAGNWPDEQS
jgi:hypothetical protein